MISVREKFLNFCKKFEIKVIYDCGSLNALDGLYLLENLKAEELHIFECNPESIKIIKKNINLYNGKGKIFINELAIANFIGETSFFAIDTKKTITTHKNGNPGASSLLKANPLYPKEKYVQKEIIVQAITLDHYISNHRAPDLIWMDLQGAELMALQGALNCLNEIKIIHTEVCFRPVYEKQPLFWDINNFLVNKGFSLEFIDLGRWPKILWLYKILNTGPWIANAIYARK